MTTFRAAHTVHIWLISGRASFSGDAYTQVDEKFAYKNLEMHSDKIEKRIANQNHLYQHQTIQWNTEMFFANDARFPFTPYLCAFRHCLPRVVWSVLRLNPAFCVLCTHHFHDFGYSQKFALTQPPWLINGCTPNPHPLDQYTVRSLPYQWFK